MRVKDLLNNKEYLKEKIDELWEIKELDKEKLFKNRKIILKVIDFLDKGLLKVVEKEEDNWKVNEYVKKAILLYFIVSESKRIEFRGFTYFDKIPLKRRLKDIRVVPGAVIRYGSYLEPNVVVMPSFINIGAYVGANTMVDTWVTVGSCAYVGKNVHLAGGVGIGGVLEPPSALPVIIEDNCFIGSRCIIVEGAVIKKGAVLAANVVITSSTKIIDINTGEVYNSYIPEDSVVIPGTYYKETSAGKYGINCALIIGKRKETTNIKTMLNQFLRS